MRYMLDIGEIAAIMRWQAVGGVWLGFRKEVLAMTVIPMSLFEIIHIILTVILILVTWFSRGTKDTKK